MIKYSFIMPYYKRAKQLHNTLTSFMYFYGNRTDFEIIIVEDAKNFRDDKENLALLSEIKDFDMILLCPQDDFDIIYNPAPLFNIGAREAAGQFLILTSPECFHRTDILSGLDEEFEKDENNYIVCACKSGKNIKRISEYSEFKYDFHMWYQHSEHRDCRYHFCTAISKANYNRIDGFDEDYKNGIAYDDNDFVKKVENAGIPFVLRDDLLTVHQWHERSHTRLPNYRKLLNANRQLYLSKWGNSGELIDG